MKSELFTKVFNRKFFLPIRRVIFVLSSGNYAGLPVGKDVSAACSYCGTTSGTKDNYIDGGFCICRKCLKTAYDNALLSGKSTIQVIGNNNE